MAAYRQSETETPLLEPTRDHFQAATGRGTPLRESTTTACSSDAVGGPRVRAVTVTARLS